MKLKLQYYSEKYEMKRVLLRERRVLRIFAASTSLLLQDAAALYFRSCQLPWLGGREGEEDGGEGVRGVWCRRIGEDSDGMRIMMVWGQWCDNIVIAAIWRYIWVTIIWWNIHNEYRWTFTVARLKVAWNNGFRNEHKCYAMLSIRMQ